MIYQEIGGQVVSVLAFYSNYQSSNPAEAYSFNCSKRTKINKKNGPFKKETFALKLPGR